MERIQNDKMMEVVVIIMIQVTMSSRDERARMLRCCFVLNRLCLQLHRSRTAAPLNVCVDNVVCNVGEACHYCRDGLQHREPQQRDLSEERNILAGQLRLTLKLVLCIQSSFKHGAGCLTNTRHNMKGTFNDDDQAEQGQYFKDIVDNSLEPTCAGTQSPR